MWNYIINGLTSFTKYRQSWRTREYTSTFEASSRAESGSEPGPSTDSTSTGPRDAEQRGYTSS